ncbi:MAG: hypothetical protein ACC661_06470, partial [Verrucomicrobiales bacterium]
WQVSTRSNRSSAPPAPPPEPPSVVAFRKFIAGLEEDNDALRFKITQMDRKLTTTNLGSSDIRQLRKRIVENEIRIADFQNQIKRELKNKTK